MLEASRTSWRRWAFAAAAVVVVAAGWALGPPAGAAVLAGGPLPSRSLVLPLHGSANPHIHASGGSVPTWTGSVVAAQNGNTYTYTMVGNSPFVAETDPSTTVSAPIVPLIIKLKKKTYDPTTFSTKCGYSASPITQVEASPLFNDVTYTPGGTNVGTTQYEDAFQRANFWQYTGPTGINPGYHVLLSPTTVSPVTITVPAHEGQSLLKGCSNLAELKLKWFDAYLESTVIPSLAASGVTTTTFPIFVTKDVVWNYGGCCVIGYHSAETVGAGVQTYAVADFDTTGDFGSAVADISDLAHEAGEWMDDPLGTNPTPPWGNVGQVLGCQANLEVGDPLSGTNTPVTLNGYTWHPQELAFFSWFYGGASIGVNGWYSFNDTFTSPATLCSS